MKHFAEQPLVWKQLRVETKLAILQLAIENGETSTDIAKRYGTSKAAVLGFANRRGIFFRHSRAADEAALATSKATKIKRLPGARSGETLRNINYWQANGARASAEERLQMSNAMPAFEPKDKRQLVKLVDLQERQCKWPFDTPEGLRFCGAGCEPGQSYCPSHHNRAHYRGGER